MKQGNLKSKRKNPNKRSISHVWMEAKNSIQRIGNKFARGYDVLREELEDKFDDLFEN